MWKAIIMSAIIFGLIHIPNLFFMEPLTVIVQVINAMSAGILFAVIFVKCSLLKYLHTYLSIIPHCARYNKRRILNHATLNILIIF